MRCVCNTTAKTNTRHTKLQTVKKTTHSIYCFLIFGRMKSKQWWRFEDELVNCCGVLRSAIRENHKHTLHPNKLLSCTFLHKTMMQCAVVAKCPYFLCCFVFTFPHLKKKKESHHHLCRLSLCTHNYTFPFLLSISGVAWRICLADSFAVW